MEEPGAYGAKLQVRKVVREAQNVLKNTSSDGATVSKTLRTITRFLPNLQHQDNDSDLPLSVEHMREGRYEFMSSHYQQWLEMLVGLFSVDFIEKLPRGQVSILLDVFFLQGIPAESFTVLVSSISKQSTGYQLQKCVSLLETFVRDHQMARILWDQCELGVSRGQVARGGKVDPYTQQQWHHLITLIATVPERVTNKLHKETSDVFYPDHYVKLVANDFLTTLQRIHGNLKTNKECSIHFLGQLLGKLCVSGYGDVVWGLLVPQVAVLVEKDFVWSRVCEGLITRVPDTSLEAVITPLIRTAPWYVTVNKFLGNSVVTSRQLNYLLTNKLLLLRHFKEDKVPQNIIGHLSSSPSRKHLYVKLLTTLFEVWGDASAVRHTSYDQHQYICRAILICLAFLDNQTAAANKEKLTQCLLMGMQPHLESSLPAVRRLGMVVAEQVSLRLDPNGDHKLQFEYERDAEVERLLDLLTPPSDPGPTVLPDDGIMDLQRKIEATNLEPGPSSANLGTAMGTADDESDLDSDDDLQPYDLSNDTKASKVKAPVYLRDCMEGVMSSDDGEKVEACLLVADKLIRNHPSTVDEVAAEFSKILLHLEDNFTIPAFRTLRHASMVALAVTSPIQVAEYLTKEFYGRNYNLRQRMDILEVLSAAAQELSKPSSLKGQSSSSIVTPKIEMVTSETEPEAWRDVVQRRIDSKTRRLTKGSQQPQRPEVANRFAPVAGHFFFPLLKNFDRPEVTLDLLGEDHVVLGRLLYALGMIVYSAAHAPVVRQMGSAMMEFVWMVRFHPQPSVRQAALFAVSMVILALPGFTLVTDLHQETVETKTWLEGVVQNDVDKECQKMALQALVLLENVCKQEFGGLSASSR